MLQQNPPVLDMGCQLAKAELYDGHKTAVVVVVVVVMKTWVTCFVKT